MTQFRLAIMRTTRCYYYCTGRNLELPSGVVREIPILGMED